MISQGLTAFLKAINEEKSKFIVDVKRATQPYFDDWLLIH